MEMKYLHDKQREKPFGGKTIPPTFSLKCWSLTFVPEKRIQRRMRKGSIWLEFNLYIALNFIIFIYSLRELAEFPSQPSSHFVQAASVQGGFS